MLRRRLLTIHWKKCHAASPFNYPIRVTYAVGVDAVSYNIFFYIFCWKRIGIPVAPKCGTDCSLDCYWIQWNARFEWVFLRISFSIFHITKLPCCRTKPPIYAWHIKTKKPPHSRTTSLISNALHRVARHSQHTKDVFIFMLSIYCCSLPLPCSFTHARFQVFPLSPSIILVASSRTAQFLLCSNNYCYILSRRKRVDICMCVSVVCLFVTKNWCNRWFFPL